jgi:hypothetical protein
MLNNTLNKTKRNAAGAADVIVRADIGKLPDG